MVVIEGIADPEERQALDDELEAPATDSITSRKARQDYAASFGAARFARKE